MSTEPGSAPAPPAGGRDEELVMFLERDQLSADTSVPVARVQWSRRARGALWALRVFVLVVGVMVVYAFVASLR